MLSTAIPIYVAKTNRLFTTTVPPLPTTAHPLASNIAPYLRPTSHRACSPSRPPRQHRLLARNHHAPAETTKAPQRRGKQQGLRRNIEKQLSTADHFPAQEKTLRCPLPSFYTLTPPRETPLCVQPAALPIICGRRTCPSWLLEMGHIVHFGEFRKCRVAQPIKNTAPSHSTSSRPSRPRGIFQDIYTVITILKIFHHSYFEFFILSFTLSS
jgi:hypothetical protein